MHPSCRLPRQPRSRPASQAPMRHRYVRSFQDTGPTAIHRIVRLRTLRRGLNRVALERLP